VTQLDQKGYVDVLLKLYGEQVAHARHHESMRAQSTNYILAASIALVGVLAANKVLGFDVQTVGGSVAMVLVLFLNLFGVLLSRKHTERSRLHHLAGDNYRSQISKEVQIAGFVPTEELRDEAHAAEQKEYPFLSQYLALHTLWEVFHVIFIALAVALFLLESPPAKH